VESTPPEYATITLGKEASISANFAFFPLSSEVCLTKNPVICKHLGF